MGNGYKTLTPDTKLKLVKILGMLGSEFDGERANAAMQATLLLKDMGLTWYQLFLDRDTTKRLQDEIDSLKAQMANLQARQTGPADEYDDDDDDCGLRWSKSVKGNHCTFFSDENCITVYYHEKSSGWKFVINVAGQKPYYGRETYSRTSLPLAKKDAVAHYYKMTGETAW